MIENIYSECLFSLRNFMKSEISVLQQFKINKVSDVTIKKRKNSGGSNHPTGPYTDRNGSGVLVIRL